MPKFNRRSSSHTQDRTANRAILGSDTNTASNNIAAKGETQHSLPSDLAESSHKQPMVAGTPVEETVLNELATAARLEEKPASVLHEIHTEESCGPTVIIPDQLRPGKLFAWFELQRELNIGSTGAVWLARDYSVRRHVEEVALKFLPDFIVSAKTPVDELKKEIRRRIVLKHPNILRVYDIVESKGRVAIQMEYQDGQSLSRSRLTRPNQIFEVRELGKWVKQLCEALEYAHNDVGFVAGGILPDNLIIDHAGNLKLKDFGIANCITNSMRRFTVIPDTNETLPYKSPQRAAGEEPAITDDLYSLGATIYELLTSKPPFYAGDIGVQVTGKIPPLMTERRAELGIKGESIPRNWEETVAACLAIDPVQRPQSAVEVEKRLKNSNFPSDIPPTSAVKSPLTRKPSLVVAGIIFILAIVSVIVFFSFHHLSEPELGGIALNTTPAKANVSLDGAARDRTPVKELLPTSTVPPSPSGSAGKESSLSVTTPSPKVNPTPSSEVSPTPSSEVSPTPSSEVSPTPSSEVSPTPSPEVSPTPSPEVSPTVSPEASPTLSSQEVATPNAKQSAGPSPTQLNQNDIDATKEDVVKRINALPGVTAQRKANLIEKMHKAHSMERLTVIPFEIGQTTLRRATTDELVKAFDSTEMRDKLSDPTTILVVAGYADTGGRPDLNLHFSQERAENVSKILKEKAKLLNAMQTIGMGGTELLDSKRPDQNRAVEVWAVVPF